MKFEIDYPIAEDNDMYIDDVDGVTFSEVIEHFYDLIEKLSATDYFKDEAKELEMKSHELYLVHLVDLIGLQELHKRYHRAQSFIDEVINEVDPT